MGAFATQYHFQDTIASHLLKLLQQKNSPVRVIGLCDYLVTNRSHCILLVHQVSLAGLLDCLIGGCDDASVRRERDLFNSLLLLSRFVADIYDISGLDPEFLASLQKKRDTSFFSWINSKPGEPARFVGGAETIQIDLSDDLWKSLLDISSLLKQMKQEMLSKSRSIQNFVLVLSRKIEASPCGILDLFEWLLSELNFGTECEQALFLSVLDSLPVQNYFQNGALRVVFTAAYYDQIDQMATYFKTPTFSRIRDLLGGPPQDPRFIHSPLNLKIDSAFSHFFEHQAPVSLLSHKNTRALLSQFGPKLYCTGVLQQFVQAVKRNQTNLIQTAQLAAYLIASGGSPCLSILLTVGVDAVLPALGDSLGAHAFAFLICCAFAHNIIAKYQRNDPILRSSLNLFSFSLIELIEKVDPTQDIIAFPWTFLSCFCSLSLHHLLPVSPLCVALSKSGDQAHLILSLFDLQDPSQRTRLLEFFAHR